MSRLIDLTHVLTPETPLFPVYDPVRVADKFNVAEDGFYVRAWAFDEHSGTHVDAPAHFGGSATVDAIPVEELLLEAVVVDVGERVAATPTQWSCPTTCWPGRPRTGRCPSAARSWLAPAGAHGRAIPPPT